MRTLKRYVFVAAKTFRAPGDIVLEYEGDEYTHRVKGINSMFLDTFQKELETALYTFSYFRSWYPHSNTYYIGIERKHSSFIYDHMSIDTDTYLDGLLVLYYYVFTYNRDNCKIKVLFRVDCAGDVQELLRDKLLYETTKRVACYCEN